MKNLISKILDYEKKLAQKAKNAQIDIENLDPLNETLLTILQF